MQALILAAGDGTRMRPLTANTPKPLLFVAGQPFLAHTLSALAAHSITDIHMIVGWRAQRLRDALGDGSRWGVHLHYIVQKERRGTADAIGLAADHIDERFLCLNGDVIVDPDDLAAVIARTDEVDGTILSVKAVDETGKYGVVVVQEGRVKQLLEKPKAAPSKLINAGIYVFGPEIFDAINATELSPRGEYEITDSIAHQIEHGPGVHAHVLDRAWLDVGYPWDLLAANALLMQSTMNGGDAIAAAESATIEERVTVHGSIRVGEGTVIKSGTYIEGECVIGADCEIGPNAYLRGSTALGDRVKIGAAVEIKNSIVMDDSNVPHHSYVGDSIIGQRCNLGSGTKIANLRLDDKNVHAVVKGKRVDTGRRKLGAIIGDDVKTGINSSINVGTIIGERSFIGPGARANGTIAPQSRVL